MRKIFLVLLLSLFTFGLAISDVHAKRFGGGRSFGMQRSVSSANYSRPQPMQAQARPSSASRWLAPLAGLALGGLLGSLFMGHGLASGLLTWLGIGAVVLLLINLFRNRRNPVPQSSSPSLASNDVLQNAAAHFMNNSASSSASASSSTIPGFEADAFLREAKVQFIRLQSAYDQKNLADLREFTSPEVFAEIQLQLHERGNAENHTEVVSLDAHLLETSNEPSTAIVSVRFTGSIREDKGETVSLNEVWHFQNYHQSRWLVAGIQQSN